MLFHSPEFLIFILIVLGLIALVRQHEPRKAIYLLSSYIFYMWWNPSFILLIMFSTIVDFWVGRRLHQEKKQTRRKLWLLLSLCANLGLLGFFKYFNFFEDNLLYIMRWMGHEPSWISLHVILPVGISFYTFQTLSYTIDIYRRDLKPVSSLLDFSVFVAFFPQLVAGPIVRAKDFLPQLKTNQKLDFRSDHFLLVLKGLFKKVIIADNLALLVDGVFHTPEIFPSIVIWIATLCFAVQIYCDFSGYTDMAIGIAAIFGFRFPLNFNKPYFAKSPSDFWRRWHISLSTWLRDYLYISLGGNRKGSLLTYRNLLITMILGGLWHGASWNFVIWGALHGFLLILYRLFNLDKIIAQSKSKIIRFFSWAIMQYFVLLTWITFRVTDFTAMKIAVKKFVLFDFDFALQSIGLGKLRVVSTMIILMLFLAIHQLTYSKPHLLKRVGQLSPINLYFFTIVMTMTFYFLWPIQEVAFIYFQF